MPVWIEKHVALVYHDELLAEHGGAPGIRDQGLLESALARPKNIAAYGKGKPTLFRMAAAYASGLLRNHPFIDGNKRTALVVAIAFLELNGVSLTAGQEETYLAVYDLAAGRITKDDFEAWLQRNST
ncbi:MAG: type II toxin-antitoxin system death-on-curing family toxin [Acidobacteriaceae bacterium]